MTYSIIAFLWMILGFSFIIIEFFITGIGLLFLGIGGLLNAILIYNSPKVLAHQYTSFGLITLLCFIFLWKPLKKYAHRTSNTNSDFNLVGSAVTVVNNEISPGKLGTVRWSGTIMNAILAESEKEIALVGDKLYVYEVQGNTLICHKNSKINS